MPSAVQHERRKRRARHRPREALLRRPCPSRGCPGPRRNVRPRARHASKSATNAAVTPASSTASPVRSIVARAARAGASASTPSAPTYQSARGASAAPTAAHMWTSEESGRSAGRRQEEEAGRGGRRRAGRSARTSRAPRRGRARACGTGWRPRASRPPVVPLVRNIASAGPHARSRRRKAAVGTAGTSSQRATPRGVTPRRSQTAAGRDPHLRRRRHADRRVLRRAALPGAARPRPEPRAARVPRRRGRRLLPPPRRRPDRHRCARCWTNLSSNRVVQGGSTITQQVVKALLLTPERSYERKMKEAGPRAPAREQAQQGRHPLPVPEPDLLRRRRVRRRGRGARVLRRRRRGPDARAGARCSPACRRRRAATTRSASPKQALARQRYVLERMREEGFITPAQHEAARAEEIAFAPRGGRRTTSPRRGTSSTSGACSRSATAGRRRTSSASRCTPPSTRRCRRAAEEALRAGLREIDRRQGFRGPLRHIEPRKIDAFLDARGGEHAVDPSRARGVVTRGRAPQGLVVAHGVGARPRARPAALTLGRAPLSPSTFKPGDVIAAAPSSIRSPDGTPRFALDQEPQVEGALVAIDPYTGQVKAMVGGYDFRRSQFNRAVQARRQPGSAIKPLIYAAAIDKGFTPRVDRARRADRARERQPAARGCRATTRTATTGRCRCAWRSRARSTR